MGWDAFLSPEWPVGYFNNQLLCSQNLAYRHVIRLDVIRPCHTTLRILKFSTLGHNIISKKNRWALAGASIPTGGCPGDDGGNHVHTRYHHVHD